MVVLYAGLSYRQHRQNPKDTTIPNLSQFVEGWKRMLTPDGGRGRTWSPKDLWPPTSRVWLIEDVWATYSRLFVGMLVGVLLAFVVGVAMGCFAQAESFLLPPLNFFAKIPPTAMLAVYFVLFGTELKMYVAMIALGICPHAGPEHPPGGQEGRDRPRHLQGLHAGGFAHGGDLERGLPADPAADRSRTSGCRSGLAMVFLMAAEMACRPTSGSATGCRSRAGC